MTKHDWQAAFGAPDASFDATIRQTLDHLEEEQKMLKISVRTVVLALALLLALTGVVFAATTGWRIGDYFGRRGPGGVPQDFDTGYQEDYTREMNGVRFRIRDAYMDGNTLYAITEVSRVDGKPAIFMGDGTDESDPIDDYDPMLSWEPRDGRSIRQYADENGLPVYFADAWFTQHGNMLEGAGDSWAEDGFLCTLYLAAIEGIQIENGLASLEWALYLRDEAGESSQMTVNLTLPVDDFTAWEVPVNQAVEGLPVVVDTLYLQQSRMELQVDIAYHLDGESMPDVPENDESAAGFRYRFIHLCDPVTGERLPEGARITGTLRWLNEDHTAFQGDAGSVRGEYTGDTIQLRFYDPWLDDYVGSIDVKIR